MILVTHEFKYLVYISPKSGCTVTRGVFLDLHRNEFPLKADVHTVTRYCNVTMSQAKEYERMMVYRNPFDRILSLYFDKVVRLYSKVPQPFPQVSMRKFVNYIFGDKCPTFEQFLDVMLRISTTPETNHHFTEQVCSFTLPPPQILFDIADFKSFCDYLISRYFASDTKRLKILNGTHEKFNNTPYRDFDRLMNNEDVVRIYEEHGVCPCLNNFLTRENMQKIRDVYRHDFAYFESKGIYFNNTML